MANNNLILCLIYLFIFCYYCKAEKDVSADQAGNITASLECQDTESEATCEAFVEKTQQICDFSHMALLGMEEEEQIHWVCSGVPLNDQFILTVAHCVSVHSKLGPIKWIQVAPASPDAQNFSIEEIYTHPDYKPDRLYNDIALIKIKDRIKFGRDVKQGCLYNMKDLPTESKLIQTSRTSSMVNLEDDFNKIEIQPMDTEACSKKFKTNSTMRLLPMGIAEETQLCAVVNEPQDKESCPFNGRGELVTDMDSIKSNRVKVLALAAFGKSCMSEMLYTQVYPYIPWIKNTIDSSF